MKKIIVLIMVLAFLIAGMNNVQAQELPELKPLVDEPAGYYYIDADGVRHDLKAIGEVEESPDGILAAGYFYDIKDNKAYRGIVLKIARTKLERITLTLSAGGLEKSTDIGDLDGTMVLSTDLRSVLETVGWEFLYFKEVELGLFFQFISDTKYGLFAAFYF